MNSLSKTISSKSSQMSLKRYAETHFVETDFGKGEEGIESEVEEKEEEEDGFVDFEQISLDSKISSSNVGYKLLQKMGWKGKGLGKSEQGIVEPIRAGMRDAKLGVGKQEEDDYYTKEENITRKKLDVEIEETEEMAKKREEEAEREDKIKKEIKEIQKVFFCKLCNKQYKFVNEFENHLSSYDHNHKKRYTDMRNSQLKEKREEIRKKEKMKEEKELIRLTNLANARKLEQEKNKSISEKDKTEENDKTDENDKVDLDNSATEAKSEENSEKNENATEKSLEQIETTEIPKMEKDKTGDSKNSTDSENEKRVPDLIATENLSVTKMDTKNILSENRTALKFGFSGKGTFLGKGAPSKKRNPKEKILSIFQDESDDET